MSIDIESGKIFIAKKNTLAPGDYTVSVKKQAMLKAKLQLLLH